MVKLTPLSFVYLELFANIKLDVEYLSMFIIV